MMKDFDFRFPFQAIGFHSGWQDGHEDVSFAKRREVSLIEFPYYDFQELKKSRLNIKNWTKGASNHFGLSSGMGSALVKTGSDVVRIKRAGYMDYGFYKKPTYRMYIDLKESLLKGYLHKEEYMGLYNPEEANNEILVRSYLKEHGINVDDIIAQYYYNYEGVGYCSNIFHISSDLRGDEVLCMCLFVLWKELLDQQKAVLIKKEGIETLIEKPLDLNTIDELFSIYCIDDIIYSLGFKSGSELKLFHDIGLLRGYNDSWIGNLVICEDASMQFTDFDRTMIIKEHLSKNKNAINIIKQLEYDTQIEVMFDLFGSFRSFISYFLCQSFLKGLKMGYESNLENKLNKKSLHQLIKRYLEIYEIFIPNSKKDIYNVIRGLF